MLLSKLANDRSQLHSRGARAKHNVLDLDLEWINFCLHSFNRGGRARVCSEIREWILVTLRRFSSSGVKVLARLNAYGLFDLVKRTTSRQMGFANVGLRWRDNVRAVDHVALILTKRRDLFHVLFKGGPHVVFVVDVLLPIAGRARVYKWHW
jgi:hypothetical protein